MAQPVDSTRQGRPRNRFNPTEQSVQRTRAFTGLLVVVGGDIAIAAGAIYGVIRSGSGQNNTQIVAILTSAFTAIGTMTTAYFGIRAASNTAQAATAQAATAQAATAQAATAQAARSQQPNGAAGATVDGSTGQSGNGGTASSGEQTGAGTQTEAEAQTGTDRPTEEPEGASQQDQYDLLRETGNERRDMTEEEEAGLLEEEFGQADADGIYGAPEGEEKGAPEGEEKGAPEGEEKGAPEGEEKGAPEGEEKP
jgi:hypothetical protein